MNKGKEMSHMSPMHKKNTIHQKFNQLRRQAEQLMNHKDFITPLTSVKDPLELIHELQTFQVELELQNEELHRSQQELMEFKKRYTELYDFTPVGYICLDKKGVIRTANLTLADMLSAQRSSLINQAFSDYVLFEDQDIFYRHIRDLAEVKTRQICELRMRKKDGTPLDVQLESTVISYKSDRSEQYRTVIIDISARKQMEKEKQALQIQLHERHKMESIRTISGGIAHNFNNILFIILGNVDLAFLDFTKGHPIYPKLKRIKTAALRASAIVRLLLSFSHTARQEQIPMDAVSVIRESLPLLRASIPTTIDIHTDFPDREVMILSDKIQFGQILMNLCTNAAQAMEETGGRLEIKVETRFIAEGVVEACPAGEYAEITVSDNGPGIDPDIMARLFDPYFTTREVGKGSGLGLAVVHTLVKNHNGTITVENRPEKGAVFTMLLPMVDGQHEKTGTPMEASSHGTERILFVDDEDSITQMAQEALTSFDYRVETQSDPEDALAMFTLNPGCFDVVITDMTMPKMTGANLAEKLRKIRPDIPIILCTGYSSLIDEEKARHMGIAAYMMKPVSMSEIARTIRKLLDGGVTGA